MHATMLCPQPVPASQLMLACLPLRFTEVFNKDEHDMPRTWGTRANIPAAAQQARQAALLVLALLAVTRLTPGKVRVNVHNCTHTSPI